MKKFHRILSALLCLALLLPTVATVIFAVAPDWTRAVPPSAPTELDSLSSYLHASVATEDNTSHLPVNVHTYYDSNKTYTPNTIGVDGSVSILYVMNTNTERLGNKTDAELVQSFLDRGFFVIVLDYMDNPAACGTDLDWSVQDIRCQVIGGAPFAGGRGYTSGTYTDGKLVGEDPICAKSYIVPSGYDIAYNIPYFSYDKHGVAGTFEIIVEIWNNDFKSVKRDFVVKWVNEDGTPKLDKTEAITEKAQNDTKNVDYATWFKTADKKGAISQSELEKLTPDQQKQYQYTYIGNTKATEVTDCVKMDGTMVDLNLYFDIIYPADYDGELPAMIAMSSNYTRTASWTGETRPYLNGPLFNGYVGIVSDYGLVPMCRNDHYGYFCGDSQLNSISGDNGTYSLSYYNGIHSDTALLRTIRKIAVDGLEVDGFGTITAPINPEKIGAYGNSKAGVIVRLANPTPEKLAELRNAEGHVGETRLEAIEGGYPYVDPYIEGGATTDSRINMPEIQPSLTYNNGEVIHSGLNFVFANCGGASNTLTEGSAPIFGVGTQAGQAEGSYYTYYATTANLARNLDIPFFGLVAPTIAHDLGYGLDRDYGIDILGAFNRYANYWLADDNAECIIIDVDTTQDICVAADVAIDNVYEIGEDSSIKLQFTGPIDESEIEKVKIISLSTGAELNGDWHGSYGDQQWKFIPYDIKDATYYTVIVPDNIVAKNGKPLNDGTSHTFRTASGVTEDAVSVTLPEVQIASYDCVNRGFSVAAAGYTLDQSTYKFNAFKGTGYGLELDLRAINDTNAASVNNNQNVRLPIFDEIWADSSYIGKTVKFTFEAKASKEGSIKLALNQHGNGDYVWGDGWGVISTDTKLGTEFQTYTYEFVVTQEMFDARAQSTSSTPDIALGVRFSGFLNEENKYKDAKLNFRNFKTFASPDAVNRNLTDTDTPLYFNFADKDYSAAKDITLRFAVTNDAINTVGVYAVNGGTLGEKLGEVIVTGAGIYNFDVTDYVKNAKGAPVVAVRLEQKIGSATLKDFDYEGSTTGIDFTSISKSVITNEIPNSDGAPNNSVKYEYMVRSAYYIDLDNELVSKYVPSLAAFANSSLKSGAFNESDYGRRFRVSFRVYDETSRVVNVYNGDGYNFEKEIADFKGSNYSFYTKAGEWTTVTIEFTVDNEIYFNEAIRSHILFFYTENKSLATLDKYAALNLQNMARAETKPGNYAGAPGLSDDYTVYGNVSQAEAAGVVTYYDDLSYNLYLDDIVIEEITTAVSLASTAPMLSITPTTAENNSPTTSDGVLSTVPNAPADGLYISGGKDGFDTKSVKSYVKISLENYYGGFAGFVFNAKSQANSNIYVYGVADVASGQDWSSKLIDSSNAPANDIYGSGVNINSVFGNAPIKSFSIGTVEQTCVVEFTEFAENMLEKGAKEITLIIVTDSPSVTTINVIGSDAESLIKIAEFDCVNKRPTAVAAGFSNLDTNDYQFHINSDTEGVGVDLRTAYNDVVKTTTNVRYEIFNNIWADRSYIGKTIRFSFAAKANMDGSIELGLNQRQKYAFNNFPGFNETASLTEDWQTFTFEFVVTEDMYTIITNGDDANGIQPPGLALGIHFAGFNDGTNKYKGAQIMFRNFVIYEVPEDNSETVTNIVSYDCVTAAPSYGAAGYALATGFKTNTNEGIQFDLTKFAANNAVNANQNVRLSIFDQIWKDRSYIGKTIRFSFSAKASKTGDIGLSLNQRQKYSFNNFPGLSESAALTTSWKTYTFEFVVTQAMYDCITNGDDPNGIEATGLALGIRFTGFIENNLYNGAQITFRNFVVSTVEYHEQTEEEAFIRKYDFSTSTPTSTYSGYQGNSLSAITDGAINFYAGNITNCNGNQNFRLSVFDDIFGTHTENIGKTYRVIFKAKATKPGQLDLSLNTGTGGKGNPAKPNGAFDIYPGHTWAFNLTDEYETYDFSFVALEGMYDTVSYATIQLGVRLYNGFSNGSSYDDAIISIDEIIVVEDPYVRTIDVNYDFETTKPTYETRGYGKSLVAIVDGSLEIDLTKDTQAPNANEYARVVALDQIFTNSANVGKTFSLTFRAKATEAGVMDMAFNKLGSFNTYTYGGITHKAQYSLTTEWKTFTYTFTVVDDMITTHAATNINLAFRFYNGFLASSSAYKAEQIYIDDIHVRHELDVTNTTLPITDSVAISGAGNSDTLTVYADDSATGAPEIYKSYFTYDLTDTTVAYGATLGVNLSGANGETVKVYLLSGVTLPTPLTYANAPVPTTAAAGTFVAKNGMNYVDIGAALAECVGKKVVIVLAIEEPSEKVEITAEPVLTTTRDYHNYTDDAQKHPAIAPTHTHSGNVEFYTCLGCERLYVKQGESFVEVEYEDVFLAPVSYISGASLNLGEDLNVRYHVALLGGESISDFEIAFTMNGKTVTVNEAHYDEATQSYVFLFSGIAPQCMGDTISAELYKNGELVDSKSSYSVKEYVVATLAAASGSTELCQLLSDLLVYGREAQKYVEYKVYNLVTDGVDLSAASNAAPSTEDNNKSVTANDGEVKFTAAGVRFANNNRIYVKLTAPTLDGVTVSVNGINLEITKANGNNAYIAYSDAISALDFAEKVIFTLSVNGEAVQTLTYTVNDYALAKYNDAEIGELALALYRYGKSTVAYASTLKH